MAVDTARFHLGFFVDAAVEVLDDADLRMTAMTRHSWAGVDKDLVDRALWELQDHDQHTVARMLKVKPEFINAIASLSGANGGSKS